jgi:hypothetical protein
MMTMESLYGDFKYQRRQGAGQILATQNKPLHFDSSKATTTNGKGTVYENLPIRIMVQNG